MSFLVSDEMMNLFKSKPLLFYVCLVILLIYICIANPRNTPAFFSTFWMKGILFLLVCFFTFHDHMLGCFFAFAMFLTIAYSYLHKHSSLSSPDTFLSTYSPPVLNMTHSDGETYKTYKSTNVHSSGEKYSEGFEDEEITGVDVNEKHSLYPLP